MLVNQAKNVTLSAGLNIKEYLCENKIFPVLKCSILLIYHRIQKQFIRNVTCKCIYLQKFIAGHG